MAARSLVACVKLRPIGVVRGQIRTLSWTSSPKSKVTQRETTAEDHEVTYPPYNARSLPFEAPVHAHEATSVLGNVVLPKVRENGALPSVAIPLLPGIDSREYDDSIFSGHERRVSPLGYGNNIASPISHLKVKTLPPQDPASAPGVPVHPNPSLSSQPSPGGGFMRSSIRDWIDDVSSSGQNQPNTSWSQDWKFDPRALDSTEKNGLWVLAGLIGGGFVTASVLAPKRKA